MPLTDETTGLLLVGCLLGLAAWTALAAAARTSGGRWTATTVAPQLLLALPVGALALDLVTSAVDNVLRLAERVGSPGAAPLEAVLGSPTTVTTPVLLVPAVCLLALAAAVHLPAATRRTGLLAAAALALPTTAVALAAGPAPLGLVVATAAVPGLVAAVLALTGRPARRTALLLAAAVPGGTALLAALPSAALTALVLAPVVTVTAALTLTGAPGTARPGPPPGRCWHPPPAGWPGRWATWPVSWSATARCRCCSSSACSRCSARTPPWSWRRPSPSCPTSAVALLAVAADPTGSVTGSASVALAVHLTLAGALVCASAALNPSRRSLAWPGGLLLAAATWVRLADLGVTDPEAYTLPTALALVAVGIVRLRRDPDAPTRSTLLPGLVLATLPSLLVVLADGPVSPRAAALGLGCLVLLLAGARVRWSAPVVVGGATGAVLVLAELAPYAAVVPQWLLLAAAGALLTAVGVTWEDRSTDARRAARYLVRLR